MTDVEILAKVMFDDDKEVVQACCALMEGAPNKLLMHPVAGDLYKCNLCVTSGLIVGTDRAIEHLRKEHYAHALRAQQDRFVHAVD